MHRQPPEFRKKLKIKKSTTLIFPVNPSAQRRVPSRKGRGEFPTGERLAVRLSFSPWSRVDGRRSSTRKSEGRRSKRAAMVPLAAAQGRCHAKLSLSQALVLAASRERASERACPRATIFRAPCLDSSRILAMRPGPIRAIRRQMAGDGLMRLWPCQRWPSQLSRIPHRLWRHD